MISRQLLSSLRHAWFNPNVVNPGYTKLANKVIFALPRGDIFAEQKAIKLHY